MHKLPIDIETIPGRSRPRTGGFCVLMQKPREGRLPRTGQLQGPGKIAANKSRSSTQRLTPP